jgi:hypothetical protein
MSFQENQISDLIDAGLIEQYRQYELSEYELTKLGFEIVRWKEPNYSVGIDRFHKLDYAILKINKNSGNSDDLCVRFKEGKYILDGYYSVRFYTVGDVEDLIMAVTKTSQKR